MYKNTGLKESLIQEIIGFCGKYGVSRAVLFGSRARGDYRERSDIDLAIWGGDETGFKLDLEDNTQTLLFYDVINMQGEVNEKLRESIKREGILLYEKG